MALPLFAGGRQDPVIASKTAQLHRVQAEREVELRMHTAELARELTDWEALQARLATIEGELVPLAQARSRAALSALQRFPA